jgi:hypothetical protein
VLCICGRGFGVSYVHLLIEFRAPGVSWSQVHFKLVEAEKEDQHDVCDHFDLLLRVHLDLQLGGERIAACWRVYRLSSGRVN